jgi:copper chaperone CopZ|tara:strand:+ start:527 stop:868 length:342 start_codon:yes stop_codon:yes gene_type:complete
MRNKLLTDTLILTSALLVLSLFFKNSFSENNPDSLVSISVDSPNLEFNKEKVESDLNTLNSVASAEISIEVGVISMEIDNNAFNPKSVKKILDKWGIESKDDWDIEVIASSEF